MMEIEVIGETSGYDVAYQKGLDDGAYLSAQERALLRGELARTRIFLLLAISAIVVLTIYASKQKG
jgi:hypothetical protein